MRLVPFGEVPDETAHIVRAYALSTGQWIGRRVPPPPGESVPQAGYEVDTGLFTISFASREPGGIVTAALARDRSATGWSNQTIFTSVPNTASYAPVFYLLSGAALGAGHLAGLGPEFCVFLARTANMLGFAVLGTAALMLARRARLLLFALLCLPSSLALAASVNQDGLLIAAAVLAAALLTRPAAADRRWAALVLAAVCLAKPPYLPLVALLLVPPMRWRWRGVAGGAGLAVLASLPAVAWSLAALRWTVVPFFTGPYAPGPLYTGPVTSFGYTDSGAQLAILRSDPSLLLFLPIRTAATWWRVWLDEVVGVLGQLSLVLPGGLYALWFAALACAAAGDVLTRSPAPAATPSLFRSTVVLLAILASLLMVFLVQFLSWTHVGDPSVAGVQGRYFVPLLASAAVGLPAVPVLRDRLATAWAIPVLGAATAQFMAIPLLVVRRWYLH